jgi:hypothetical protein
MPLENFSDLEVLTFFFLSLPLGRAVVVVDHFLPSTQISRPSTASTVRTCWKLGPSKDWR